MSNAVTTLRHAYHIIQLNVQRNLSRDALGGGKAVKRSDVCRGTNMSNKDWRSLQSRLRRGVASLLKAHTGLSRRYEPNKPADLETVSVLREHFSGDVPVVAGSYSYQDLRRYARPRPAIEMVRDCTYTANGMCWHNGKIVEKFSARRPSTKDLLQGEQAHLAKEFVSTGWMIESETPFTYGDWVGDHIRAICECNEKIELLLLPHYLAEKAYVKRDLDRLEIPFLPVRERVVVKEARILRKTVPSYYWHTEQVEAYRKAFSVSLTTPRPGSILYLSRGNLTGETVHRAYPSEEISKVIRDLGGTVFDTQQASPERFSELATEAETVVADQGSAIFGVLQWKTRNLIEITTDRWWHNSNLFFSRASGVQNYFVHVCDRPDRNRIGEKVRSSIMAVQGTGP